MCRFTYQTSASLVLPNPWITIGGTVTTDPGPTTRSPSSSFKVNEPSSTTNTSACERCTCRSAPSRPGPKRDSVACTSSSSASSSTRRSTESPMISPSPGVTSTMPRTLCDRDGGMAELPVGTIFAGHEIRGVAGRGGMGIVYRALDQRLKREVALKVIAPEQSEDREFRLRFRRECEVAASLHHPNLIPVYTAGEEDGHLYVTMRYVDGIDLAHLIDREGRVPPGRAVDVIAQVAHALDAAHAFGVVHRDVKPANVLLDGDHALLTDFGLQRDLRASTRVTEPGTLIGSFDYIAPEQLEDADVDARTDVYALGCVLFETVTGEVPYPRETPAAKMYAHLGAPIPHLDGPLGPVVRRALAKHPDDRFPTAGALGAAAREALGTRPAPPPKQPTPLPTALLTETGSEPFVGRAHFRERIAEHRAAATEAGER